MSKPVPITPERARHEIRNTHGGVEFFLAHLLIRWAFQFILAVASKRYNIGIVAYAMMPNHIHIVVRVQLDPNEPYDLGEFKKFVNSNMGRFVNAYWEERRERGGSVFCKDSIGQSIKIVDDEADLETIAYVENNGVSAGIGATPACMKGAVSLRKWLTKPKTIPRPPMYFQASTWADEETLELCVPRSFEEQGLSPKEFQTKSNRVVKKMTEDIKDARKAQGLTAQSLADFEAKRPVFPESHSVAGHGRVWLTGTDPATNAAEFEEIRSFHKWHRKSLDCLQTRKKGVVFPPGTYKAVRVYGARTADMPDGSPDQSHLGVVKQE